MVQQGDAVIYAESKLGLPPLKRKRRGVGKAGCTQHPVPLGGSQETYHLFILGVWRHDVVIQQECHGALMITLAFLALFGPQNSGDDQGI